jgi:hypothetical protein
MISGTGRNSPVILHVHRRAVDLLSLVALMVLVGLVVLVGRVRHAVHLLCRRIEGLSLIVVLLLIVLLLLLLRRRLVGHGFGLHRRRIGFGLGCLWGRASGLGFSIFAVVPSIVLAQVIQEARKTLRVLTDRRKDPRRQRQP